MRREWLVALLVIGVLVLITWLTGGGPIDIGRMR